MPLILRKILRIIPILLLVSMGTSLLLELVPGDPVIAVLGETATPERYAEVETELGLDQSVPERYVSWLGGAVRGDFGESLLPPIEDVSDMIAARLPVTLEIAFLALVFSLAFAIPAGMWSAHRAGSSVDAGLSGGAFAAISVPSFLSALILIYLAVFSRENLQLLIVVVGIGAGLVIALGARGRAKTDGWHRSETVAVVGAGIVVLGSFALAALLPDFPRQGFSRITASEGLAENLRTAFLPALTLALIEGAVFMRVLRDDMVVTLREDYILAAQAKGMSTGHILVRDALRPSSFSLVTVAGVTLGRLLGGTIIVETIFGLPGMGTMLIDAIQEKNFPVVQASVMVLALFYVIVNTAVDLSYPLLDPRLRHERS